MDDLRIALNNSGIGKYFGDAFLNYLYYADDTYIDDHESKPAISILAIVQESRKTSAFRYFSSYSFYFIT